MRDANKLRAAYEATAIFLTLTIILGMLAAWYWYQYHALVTQSQFIADKGQTAERQGSVFNLASRGNIIQKMFPNVDFSDLYPGMSAQEIDLLQRESFRIRYVYTPYAQFEPMPMNGEYVRVSQHGFREGASTAPWPPNDEKLSIFVFGGSTTFGYGVPDEKTIVSAIQTEMHERVPALEIEAYNFGRGYYFSTQERMLLEQLLQKGVVPDIVVFIDGLNEYYYPDGKPRLTKSLYKYVAPDLPNLRHLPLGRQIDKQTAVEALVNRYERNVRLIEGITDAFGVKVIFIGQPVPFLHYTKDSDIHPFRTAGLGGHDLCYWGYDQFERAAKDGRFGSNFIWLGDVFANAEHPMYVDRVHYSFDGNDFFAKAIVNAGLEATVLQVAAQN